MAQGRELSDYCLMGPRSGGKFDQEKVEKLHKFVLECKEMLFDDELLQNLIFGHGYGFENRPKTFHDISDPTFLRKKTMVCLDYVNMVMDLAIKPQLAVIASDPDSIIATPDTKITVQTPEGYNFGVVEDLQKEWMRSPMSNKVREYKERLELAFDEFNMKFMVNALKKAQMPFTDYDSDGRKIQEEIKGHWDEVSSGVLDNAYYIAGKQFYQSVGKLWKPLFNNDFGGKFVLSPDEIDQAVRAGIDDSGSFE